MRPASRFSAVLVAAGWALCAVVANAAAPAAFPFAAVRTVPIVQPGTPRALAFAPDGGLAYLAVGRVLVAYGAVDAAPAGELSLPGTIAALQIAPDGRQAYAALRAPNEVAVLGLGPMRVAARWRLPVAPSSLLLDPGGRILYVESAAAGRVFALDLGSGRIRAAQALGGRLEQMAANGYGSLFVADAARNVIDVLEARTLRLAGTFPVSSCTGPSGLALDPVGRRLFVACDSGGIAVIDTDIGFTFEQLPAPPGAARGLFVRAPLQGWKGAALFASRNGTLDAVRMLAFIRYVDGGHAALPGAGDVLAFDPLHRRLWVATSKPAAVGAGGSLSILAAAPCGPDPGVRP